MSSFRFFYGACAFSRLSVHISLLGGNVNGDVSRNVILRWGWAGEVRWELLSSPPGGWPGGRAVLPAGTHTVSGLTATSLCVSSSTWIKKGALFLSFQKIGSLPGKVNFLLPETKGLFVCLVFLSRCSNPPTKFLFNCTPTLGISKSITWILWFLYYLAPKGRD